MGGKDSRGRITLRCEMRKLQGQEATEGFQVGECQDLCSGDTALTGVWRMYWKSQKGGREIVRKLVQGPGGGL